MIDKRWLDSIAAELAEMDDDWWSKGFAGDPRRIAAERIERRLYEDGFKIYTTGQDVTIYPHEAFAPLFQRFHRPRFQDHADYERAFAERIVYAIYGSGLEIRPV